jgi:Protein of unknown function (DUF3822)
MTEFGYFTVDTDDNEYKSFFDVQEVFKKRYRLSALAYDTVETVLIPSELFKIEDLQLHLQATNGHAIQSALVSELVSDWQLHTVYRLPSVVQSAVKSKFVNGQSWHINTVMLKNHLLQEAASIEIDFKTEAFSLLVFEKNKLLLAQTFSYNTPEDVLYYLLRCCRELNIPKDKVSLSLSGLIEKDSAVYRELYKYFIHIEFDNLYGQVKLSEALQVHPVHYYSTISKLAACVS